MARNRYKSPPLAKTTLSNRQVKVTSGLVASQHLSEAHSGTYARVLIWTIMTTLGLFLLWASQTPVYEVVSGNGTIRPEGLSTRIEHRDGGLITEIHVTDGDTIGAGDVIARIDDADLLAERQKLTATLAGLDEKIARFDWLLKLDLTMPVSFAAQQDSLSAPSALVEDVAYRIAQIETLRAQRGVVQAQRTALQNQIVSADAEAAILRGQIDRYLAAGNRNLTPLLQQEEQRRELLRLESNVAQLHGELAVQTASIQQMESSERELIAQNRREASLQLAEAREARIAILQSLSQVNDRLARSVVRAPVSGIINAVSIQNSGEVVAPGEIVAEIIPEGTQTFAEIEIPADRIGGVQVGREASIKILTYDFTRFGDITATVDRISPTSFVKDNGDAVFRVRLTLSDENVGSEVASPQSAHPISPGMTVVADIKSERRTVLSFLLKPIRVISDRAMTEA